MKRKLLIYIVSGFCISGIIVFFFVRNKPELFPKMEKVPVDHKYTAILEQIRDDKQPLSERIELLRGIVSTKDASLVKELLGLLKRKRPETTYRIMNWDQLGVERMVDLYIIEALNRLGDASGNNRIPDIIAHFGTLNREGYDESSNAAEVLNNIGSIPVVGSIIELTKTNDSTAIRNAVRTLNRLHLPFPPVGGETERIISQDQLVTFTIDNLKQEIEEIAKLSKGKVILTESTKNFITAHNYDRGNVVRQREALREIIEDDLDFLKLQYYEGDNAVFICTVEEAGKRWQSWWRQNDATLEYDSKSLRFTIKGTPAPSH